MIGDDPDALQNMALEFFLDTCADGRRDGAPDTSKPRAYHAPYKHLYPWTEAALRWEWRRLNGYR